MTRPVEGSRQEESLRAFTKSLFDITTTSTPYADRLRSPEAIADSTSEEGCWGDRFLHGT